MVLRNIISANANAPIITAINSIPPCRKGRPNENLGAPSIGLMPMVANSIPSDNETNPRTGEPVPNVETVTSPRTVSEKNSTVEKLSAMSAIGGAAKISTNTLKNPPMADPMMASPRAWAPSPFWVMG